MSDTPPASTVQIAGFRWSPVAHEIKDYLARNRIPYHWMDVESSAQGRELMERFGARPDDLPLVLFPDGSHLLSPTDEELAERIGLRTEAEHPFYDLVVVGGGPAGMAAAVYGASEGLRTVVVEREVAGGQAGLSAGIENYLGFPEGLTGAELAQRAVAQAERFGVEVVAARCATGLRVEEPYRVVALDDGSELYCHAVVLALGVSWRVLRAPGCTELIGRGVYYGAAAAEAGACRDQDVYLLGAGNSAGQAAVLLSRYARSVTLVAPEEDFAERMSEYLLERLQNTDNVRFLTSRKVVQAEGEGRLESITVEDVRSGEQETLPTHAVFVFIGAAPETDWLQGTIARDPDGYVLTAEAAREAGDWPVDRPPLPLESSVPGVFVAGDVRAGSVKRVGAAVGEGSSAIQHVHDYLRER